MQIRTKRYGVRSRARQALCLALHDEERDVRVAAVKGLAVLDNLAGDVVAALDHRGGGLHRCGNFDDNALQFRRRMLQGMRVSRRRNIPWSALGRVATARRECPVPGGWGISRPRLSQ